MSCRRVEEDSEFEPETGKAHRSVGKANEPPVYVRPAPRFLQDLKYLSQLMDQESLPRQLYRAKHSAALFVIGDASGKAKGAVVVSQYGLDYKSDVWLERWRGKSSNIREAKNLTDRFERLSAKSVKLAAQVAERLETLNTHNALADRKVFVLIENSAFKGGLLQGPLDEQGAQQHCILAVQGTAGGRVHPACPAHLRQEDEGHGRGWPFQRRPHRGDDGR